MLASHLGAVCAAGAEVSLRLRGARLLAGIPALRLRLLACGSTLRLARTFGLRLRALGGPARLRRALAGALPVSMRRLLAVVSFGALARRLPAASAVPVARFLALLGGAGLRLLLFLLALFECF